MRREKTAAIGLIQGSIPRPGRCSASSIQAHGAATRVLWRTTRDLPERGRIGIFNRSYYEEVLIARVHPRFCAAKRSRTRRITTRIWHDRYRSIVDFEKRIISTSMEHASSSSTSTKEEQRNAFLARK